MQKAAQNWDAYQTIDPIFRPFYLNWKDHTVAPLVSQLLTNRQLRQRFLSVLIRSLTLHKLCWNAQSPESPALSGESPAFWEEENQMMMWVDYLRLASPTAWTYNWGNQKEMSQTVQSASNRRDPGQYLLTWDSLLGLLLPAHFLKKQQTNRK